MKPIVEKEFDVDTTGFRCIRLMDRNWREVMCARRNREGECTQWKLSPGKYWLLKFSARRDSESKIHVSEISVTERNIAVIHMPPHMYPRQIREIARSV